MTVTLILLFVGLSLAACGGPSATPSGPTHRPAIVAAASAPFALVGESVMLTARNTETGELLPVVWQNQTPTIAAISGSTLTVLQHGRVRVRAEYNGAMSDLDLRGIANFNGWYPRSDPDGRTLIYGQAHLVECLTGNPLSPCANVTPGREEDLTLRLAQVGEEVSGYVYMQFGSGPVSGRVDGDGVLNGLTGVLNLKGDCCHIDSWSTSLRSSGRSMYGTFRLRFLNNDQSLRTVRRYEIRDLPRSP